MLIYIFFFSFSFNSFAFVINYENARVTINAETFYIFVLLLMFEADTSNYFNFKKLNKGRKRKSCKSISVQWQQSPVNLCRWLKTTCKKNLILSYEKLHNKLKAIILSKIKKKYNFQESNQLRLSDALLLPIFFSNIYIF